MTRTTANLMLAHIAQIHRDRGMPIAFRGEDELAVGEEAVKIEAVECCAVTVGGVRVRVPLYRLTGGLPEVAQANAIGMLVERMAQEVQL